MTLFESCMDRWLCQRERGRACCVVEENLSYIEATAFCEALQEASRWDGDWWKVVPQNYRLWGGMAELI